MTTEQLIKVALSYAGMTQAELADKIGMNKSNFNARMKRESFSRIEPDRDGADCQGVGDGVRLHIQDAGRQNNLTRLTQFI